MLALRHTPDTHGTWKARCAQKAPKQIPHHEAMVKETGHTVVGRADQVGLLANRQLRHTLVPALDDAADTDLGDERLSAVAGRVELRAVEEGAGVCCVSVPLPLPNPELLAQQQK